MLMSKIDIRLLLIVGLGLFAFSCYLNTYMSPDYSGDQFWGPNIVRAIGQAIALTPLTALAMVDIAAEDSAAASGVFNMLRNLGGAVGTALLATVVTKREQFHSNVIGSSVNLFQHVVRDRIDQMTRYFLAHGIADAREARHQAIIALGHAVRTQSMILGYSDAFLVLAGILTLACLLVLFTRKAGAVSTAVH